MSLVRSKYNFNNNLFNSRLLNTKHGKLVNFKMEVISGKIEKAKKVVLYGPEGIGKSSLAAQFPKPIFIDTEGSTTELTVDRLAKPSSWTILRQQVEWVKQQV